MSSYEEPAGDCCCEDDQSGLSVDDEHTDYEQDGGDQEQSEQAYDEEGEDGTEEEAEQSHGEGTL